MTTIAYRDGVLAADSMISTNSGRYCGAVAKIWKRDDGALLGAVGGAGDAAKLRDWFLSGSDELPPALPEEGQGILIKPDGTVWLAHGQSPMYEVDWPFHAEGSGAAFAIGAMAHGASAEQAVSIACGYDVFSGPPVVVLKVGVTG